MIFIKNEEAGRVKTRLAKAVGNERALEIYRKLLNYTFDQVDPLSCKKEVWYSSFIATDDIWEKDGFVKHLQRGADLGERMSEAFKNSFEKEDTGKTIIIGSDCAELTTDMIREAFEQLSTHDFVIGPAKDGGYYLLGMNQYHPQLFTGIEWSTDKVLKSTIRIIEQLETSYTMLRPLNDVDTIDDWQEVKHSLLKRPNEHA